MDDVVVLRLVDGRLPPEAWVYAVVAPGGEVLHVGSTVLPPAVRTWLHLEHEDPAVGRLRATVEPGRLRDAVVVAVRLPSGVDRRAVRDAVRGRLETSVGGPVGGAVRGVGDTSALLGARADAEGRGADQPGAVRQVVDRLLGAVASV